MKMVNESFTVELDSTELHYIHEALLVYVSQEWENTSERENVKKLSNLVDDILYPAKRWMLNDT